MHPCYLQCWWVLFLLLFLIHIVCLCHLRDLSPYTSSSVFFVLLLPFPFQEWFWISYKDCPRPGIYPFNEISASELGCEKFFHLSTLPQESQRDKLLLLLVVVVLLPWVSPLFTTFSYQKKKKKEFLYRTYTLLIQYLHTNQILKKPIGLTSD